jgi:hypothetical protein
LDNQKLPDMPRNITKIKKKRKRIPGAADIGVAINNL